MAAALRDSEVQITDASYGKTGVKILFVKRDSKRHEIIEYEGKGLDSDFAQPIPRLHNVGNDATSTEPAPM